MFTSADKAIAALFMAIAYLASQFGIILPEWMTDGSMGVIFTAMMPFIVWLVPNKK